MVDKMTSIQAFKAMVCFLEDYYNKTLSDDLGSLLGDMQLLENGSGTWDPAAWNDWIAALKNKMSFTPIEGFESVYNFLKAYYASTSSASSDIKIILDVMELEKSKQPHDSVVWHLWMECVKKNT